MFVIQVFCYMPTCLSVHGDISQAHLIQQVIAGREPDVAVTPAANHVHRFKSGLVVVGELDLGQKPSLHNIQYRNYTSCF